MMKMEVQEGNHHYDDASGTGSCFSMRNEDQRMIPSTLVHPNVDDHDDNENDDVVSVLNVFSYLMASFPSSTSLHGES